MLFRSGYPAVPQIGDAIRNVESLFREDWTPSADVYLPVPAPRGLHRNPRLAETYRRVLAADDPLEAWYRGFVAEEILAFQEHEWLDSSGERHAGLLAEEDLRDWAPTWEEPVSVDYHGYEVFKAGPWSQAPVFLQQLRLLEEFDLAGLAHVGAEYVHVVTECAKLAFADREAWYGDPDFFDVPLDLLLSKEYADERRALVGDTASAELRPGGDDPRLPAPAASGVGPPPACVGRRGTRPPGAPGRSARDASRPTSLRRSSA